MKEKKQKAQSSRLWPVGGDREHRLCKTTSHLLSFSPIAGARLSDRGVHLLSCSRVLTRRKYRKKGGLERGDEERRSSHGCAGGRGAFARQKQAPRRGWKCKQLRGLQERLCEELRHPSQTGPSEGLFVERVQALQRRHSRLQTVKGLCPLRRRVRDPGALVPHFQEPAK